MLEKITDATAKITDNLWAFLLFTIAAVLAFIARRPDATGLMHFAEMLATTGAAMFHGSRSKDS